MLESMPLLFIVGLLILTSYALGRLTMAARLPAVIGFMLWGVVLGPSVLDVIHLQHQSSLAFITDVTLGFVALAIGLELRMTTLKKFGIGIVTVIFCESLFAFLAVTGLVLWVTGDWVMALLFGAMAPASAPAGTVAVIQETRSRGPLTQSLYAIVGFDDGFAILIFGFSAAIAHSLLDASAGAEGAGLLALLSTPLIELGLSLGVGLGLGVLFSLCTRPIHDRRDHLVIALAFILLANGLAMHWHLSLILVNMTVGLAAANTRPARVLEHIGEPILAVMPVLYLMFFTLAGCNLALDSLWGLGLVGVAYIVGRTAGKVSGCAFGAQFGKLPDAIRKHAGLAILSQAGVAIGLALIIQREFAGLGPVVEGDDFTRGDAIGRDIITTVTATSIFFGIVGPLLTKRSLAKAGEIPAS